MSIRHIFYRERLFEFVVMIAMVGLGLQMLVFPDTFDVSAFRYILAIFTAQTLNAMYLVSGVFRLVALIANGRSLVYGPNLRAISSVLGLLAWLSMAIALVRLHFETHAPFSPGIFPYVALSIGEVFSLYWAVEDGRSQRHR